MRGRRRSGEGTAAVEASRSDKLWRDQRPAGGAGERLGSQEGWFVTEEKLGPTDREGWNLGPWRSSHLSSSTCWK